VARLILDGVAVFVLQVLAASVVDGVVVRCRGGDAQYGVGVMRAFVVVTA